MKNIAFVCEGMYNGGVEKTLIEWLKTICPQKFNVTLYLMNIEGETLNKLPDYVNIKKIPELTDVSNGAYKNRLEWVFQNKGVIAGIKFFLCSVMHKINHNRGVYYRKMIKCLSDIDDVYDYAISYTMPDSICIPYTAEKIKAKYKWMWCHTDVRFYKGHELDGMEQSFKKFDKIVNVSNAAMQTFNKKYPALIKKSIMIKNYLNTQDIINMANMPCDEIDKNVLSILTVGRISPEKGQDIAIEVVKNLALKGIIFKWYFLGPKPDPDYYLSIMNSINKENLSDKIIYLGQSDNPYKYMKNCDIYIQPSRFEGYCTTVTEAQILHKPIIVTNVAGAKEQIENDVTGIISPISAEEIEKNIIKLINDRNLMATMSDNLQKKFNIDENNFEDVINTLITH